MCKQNSFKEKIQICFYLIKNYFSYITKKSDLFFKRYKMVLSFVKDHIYFDDDKKWFFI